ncbi:MAG: isoprenylcysteine carboxylmethyltransferase family protein [Alphaproteobacteria bacterium]|nr:isoprenylcysteine carboxylmethyltransferase family protein [Alphaproteobacteria bacterium]
MSSIERSYSSSALVLAERDGAAGESARSRAYDAALRLGIALWFLLLAAWYAEAVGHALHHAQIFGWDAATATQLVAKSCLFLFVVMIAAITLARARPVARTRGVLPRLSAMLGTYLLYGLALLPMRSDLALGWHILSAALLLAGNLLAVIILPRLGRSFSIMPEARRLVTDGPYAIVRHPLYCAEQVALLGAVIQFASIAAFALYAAQFLFQLQRMRNEEAVLEQAFPDYAAYKARTARLIPGIW